jgi:hypothetical protein
MGGKGGGDYYSPEAAGYVKNPAAAVGNNEPAYMLQSEYDAKYNQPAAPAAAAPAAFAPAPDPAPAAPAPDPVVTPPDPAPMGPAIDTGGAINQPTVGGNDTPANTGDVLGSTVGKPPNFWVGGVGDYKTGTGVGTGRGGGRIRTTQ